MDEITIQSLEKASELQGAIDLQKLYWGDDSEALVVMHMLLAIVRYGGHVLGAFIDKELVGIVIGMLGTRSHIDQPAADNLLIMSKRMVVLPDLRGKQIGYRLKLAQRDIAIRQNIPLVTWTFDPLLARNAHLNIRKLGCVSTMYEQDYFGETANNPTLSADRLVVDLWTESERVQSRLDNDFVPYTHADYMKDGATLYNEAALDRNGLLVPVSVVDTVESDVVLLEIPSDFVGLDTIDHDIGLWWRDHMRQAFGMLMGWDYRVIDFVRTRITERECAYYVLEKQSSQD